MNIVVYRAVVVLPSLPLVPSSHRRLGRLTVKTTKKMTIYPGYAKSDYRILMKDEDFKTNFRAKLIISTR